LFCSTDNVTYKDTRANIYNDEDTNVDMNTDNDTKTNSNNALCEYNINDIDGKNKHLHLRKTYVTLGNIKMLAACLKKT
jgi:hypothetical protein